MKDLADRVEDTEGVAELEGTETEGEDVAPQKTSSVFFHLDEGFINEKLQRR